MIRQAIYSPHFYLIFVWFYSYLYSFLKNIVNFNACINLFLLTSSSPTFMSKQLSLGSVTCRETIIIISLHKKEWYLVMHLVTLKLDWIALTNLINKAYIHVYKYSFLYKIMT